MRGDTWPASGFVTAAGGERIFLTGGLVRRWSRLEAYWGFGLPGHRVAEQEKETRNKENVKTQRHH